MGGGSSAATAGLDVIDLPDARHQEADEVGGAAFAVWVAWVL